VIGETRRLREKDRRFSKVFKSYNNSNDYIIQILHATFAKDKFILDYQMYLKFKAVSYYLNTH